MSRTVQPGASPDLWLSWGAISAVASVEEYACARLARAMNLLDSSPRKTLG